MAKRKTERSLGHITVNVLKGSLWDMIHDVLEAKDAGFSDIEIDFSHIDDDERVYPYSLVPLAAFLSQQRAESTINFKLIADPATYLVKTSFLHPIAAGLTTQYPNVLDRVWKFSSSEDVFKLVSEYIDEIYKSDVVEGENVLRALEWSLNEVMDNVIQHADIDSGYVMGQVHKNNKHVAFCVADSGQGVWNSLQSSGLHHPRTINDALTLAFQEGVTRDTSIGQGNGLWGLKGFATQSSGHLQLSSGGKTINLSNPHEIEFYRYPKLSPRGGGTVVDFQIDYGKPISLKSILGGYEPQSLKMINMSDENGTLTYKLIEQKSGFGTRKSGERIRNEVINLQKTTRHIVLDFAGVNVISSSFADELVGKLYLQFGPVTFSNYFSLTNMNDFVETLINKAILQRLKS